MDDYLNVNLNVILLINEFPNLPMLAIKVCNPYIEVNSTLTLWGSRLKGPPRWLVT